MGYMLPGMMTAVMGMSGSGKSTILKVLSGSGKKKRNRSEGEIQVNGYPQSNLFFRVSGYVGEDVHNEMATLEEAVLFAATLRTADKIPLDAKQRYVSSLINMLELTKQRCTQASAPIKPVSELSPEVIKRLTIGVEMASNPSILFLDEPCSSLDSTGALLTTRVMRRIANRGKTLMSSLTQPSAEMFRNFDALIVLRTGGQMVFFGEVGK
eukprot:gene25113-30647_t